MASNDTSTLTVAIEGQDNITLPLKHIESSIIRFVGAVTASLAALKAATFEIGASADLQQELINVQKTTEFADTTINRFGESLKKMSQQVNVSAVDLAKIAAVGGQLGLGNQGAEALLQFTETASRMSSVLNVAVEDSANGIAKITNIFKIGLKDAERIASAFNELSNNSTASGKDLLDVVNRIGDAGGALGRGGEGLSKALGLAATGVDLGLTLETVGTSFTKVFLDMQAKSHQFAQVMKVDTADWAHLVQTDGIGALKEYLRFLRTLRADERARIAEQLTGGGRVFALINKLVQDEQNTILNKDLGFAAEGWASGTSAIREQDTVLKGLNAQMQIMGNTVTSLATIAGDKALPAVTALVKEFQHWLQQDSIKDSVIQLADSIGNIATSVVDFARFVAGLNVNWHNVFLILTAVVGLKIASVISGWAKETAALKLALSAIDGSAFTKLTASFRRVRDETKLLAANMAGAVSSATSAALSKATSALIPKADVVGRDANARQTAAATAATESYIQKLKAQGAALLGLGPAYANNIALEHAKAAAAEAGAEAKRLADEKVFASIAVVNAEQKRADELSIASAESAMRRRVLLSDQERRQVEINVERELRVRAATNQQEIAQIDAHYAQMAAASNTYYENLLAREQAALEQNLLLVREANASELLEAKKKYAALGAEQAAAVERAKAANEAVAVAQTQTLVTAGGVVVAAVGKIASLFAKALGVFLWVSLIATFLDMLGVLKPLTDGFFRLTDAIGLTSEATRKLNQENRIRQQQMEEETKKLQALRDEYFNLSLAQGGLDNSKFDARIGTAKGDKQDTAQAVFDTLKQVAASNAAQQTAPKTPEFKQVSEDARAKLEEADAALAKAEEHAARLQRQLDALPNAILNVAQSPEEMLQRSAIEAQLAKSRDDIEKLKQLRINAELSVEQVAGSAATRIAASYSQIQRQQEAFGPSLEKSMTQAVFNVTQTMILPYQLLKERQADLIKQAEELDTKIKEQQQNGQAPDAQTTENMKTAARLRIELQDITLQMVRAKESAMSVAEGMGGDAQGALVKMLLGDNVTVQQIMQIVLAVQNLLEKGGKLSGTALTAATTDKATPQATATVSSSDLALARFRAEKERIAAEVRLTRQHLDQELAEYQFYYRRQEITLEGYYDKRKNIIVAGLRGELRLRQQELKEAQIAFHNAGAVNPNQTEAQQLAATAQMNRIRGDISLLKDQIKNVDKEVNRERIVDQERVNDDLLALEGRYYQTLGDDAKAAAIQSAQEFRDAFRRLQTERLAAEEKLRAATIAGNQKQMAAANAALARIDHEVQISIVLRNLAVIRSQISDFQRDMENTVRSTFLSPGTVGSAIDGFIAKIGTDFGNHMTVLRQQFNAATTVTEKTGLEQALIRARLEAFAVEDALIELQQNAVEKLKNAINFKVTTGEVGILQASEQIAEETRKSADILLPVIRDLQDQIASGGLTDEELHLAQARLDALMLKFRELKGTLSDVANTINGDARNALEGFFNAMQDHSKSLKDAFRDMVKSITQSVNQIASKGIVDHFFGPMLKGEGSIGDFFSKMFGGAAGGSAGPLASAGKAATELTQPGKTPANPIYSFVTNLPGSFGGGGGAGLAGAIDVPENKIATVDITGGNAGDQQEKQVTSGFFATVKSGFDSVTGYVKKIFSGDSSIFDALSGFGDQLASGFSAIFNTISSMMSSSGGGSGGSGGGVGDLIALAVKYFAGSYAEGGLVTGPGTGTSDSVVARLSNREFVMPAAVTERWLPVLEMMRQGRFMEFLTGFSGSVRVHVPTTPAFAGGGLVNVDSLRSGVGQDRGTTVVKVYQTIQTPDANGFRKSRDQIASETGMGINRALRRNK